MTRHVTRTRFLVQAMGYNRKVRYTISVHNTESAAMTGLKKAKKAYPLSTWRVIEEKEITWWPS